MGRLIGNERLNKEKFCGLPETKPDVAYVTKGVFLSYFY